ncbi:F-box/kelch-repeat protein At3g23880-like [Vicia villosa]|uniref:F-box/kelch-repeat protein At3g23880-like n=1 Tax=Vicia villosa TaxID=3911 RepID=UPI00273A7AB5|nr:F-box/kelch-repeat protein At3g23880-like [Vicia villosa]
MTAVSSSSLPLTEKTASMKMSKTLTLPHLPLDVVSEILCRLSVKQLLQLCCVCKSWNSLISLDYSFARKQLMLSTPNKDRHHLIQSSIKSYHEFLLIHSPISSFFTIDPIVTVNQLRHTLKMLIDNRGSVVQISTCDGILCFVITGSRAVLYNPFTRKSKILPPLNASKLRNFQNLFTLVYDRITRNYKIIAVTFGNSKHQVNIHTLGTHHWRRVQDFPCSCLHCTPGIFVNDTLNWLAYDHNLPEVIVSLDLEKESYQKLSPPLYDDDDTGFERSVDLGTLRGCLSILSYRYKFSNVWIMKEYGNEKSWTKLFSVPHPEQGIGSFYFYKNVLYVSEDNQLLMEFYNNGEHGLVVYDSTNNTFSNPKMQNNVNDHKVAPHFYVESLISPF